MKNLLLLMLLMQLPLHAQKPVFTTAKVKSATVYFQAVEMTQGTSVMLPKGSSEIVIKNVADQLNESTIQVGAPASVTVLSVQFTNNYISEYDIDENSPAIKSVRDSIRIVEKEILKTNNAKDSEAKTIELLDKNHTVSGSSTGLQLAELSRIVDYYRQKRTELSNAYDALEAKLVQLNATMSRLKNKLETSTKNEEKISKGKIILQVMNETAGNVAFDINYVSNSASWRPFYDLRANSISEPIEMMYKAQVLQHTGVDWKQVKLALSSGNPNQNNQAPVLYPWFLAYNHYRNERMYADGDMLESVVIQEKLSEVRKDKRNAAPAAAAGYAVRSDIGQYTTAVENQLNISFTIDIPYDIISNGKAHSVALKEISIPATYKYFAAPRIDKEAFLLAEIDDYSKYNLLRGEANIIFEGMYVGKTIISPNQTTDTLSLSMGRDKKIVISRDKVADLSGTRFLSSKKEQTFTYDLTIRNNKKENVLLKLQDQYPLSSDKEVEIELRESGNAVVNSETGILTWDLNLRAGETKKIRISYKIRYPKDKTISNL